MTNSGELYAAAGAGCFATVLGHPLDCVKVHLQTRPHLARSGTLATVASLLKSDGFRAFGRGLAPPLLNAVLMNTLMFTAFNEAKRSLSETSWGGGTGGALIAGMLSGVMTAFLSTPFDFVKVQAQLRGGTTAFRVLLEVLKVQPGALMSGHTMNMAREGVFTCIYLGLYDRLREGIVDVSSAELDKKALPPSPPLHLVGLASATTGALAWIAAYPFDSIKSVQQAQPPVAAAAAAAAAAAGTGGDGGKATKAAGKAGGEHPPRATMRGAFQFLLRSGGVNALYRGCGASTGRAVLVTASRLVAYEAILSFVRSSPSPSLLG